MRDPAINAIAPAVPYTRPISFVESPNPPLLRSAFRKGVQSLLQNLLQSGTK